MSESSKRNALRYHSQPPAGKLTVTATKPLANQVDLSQAYSPGVAYPCREIAADPMSAARYTARSNLVGVVTNGSAVLGLGSIGPLAAKPVMEGKAVLFKKFANIDAFDIEVSADAVDQLIEVVAALEPTFGAINLEDIKAPDCFIAEKALRERLNIPVFHDDQHGTAIVVAAAIRNAIELVGKSLDEVRLVATGGGAASLACLNLLVELGLPREHIVLVDLHGVVYQGRSEDMNEFKDRFARDTTARTLDDAIDDADIFLGLSAPDILTAAMTERMAEQPIIMALANPDPEIDPQVARAARPDAIIATGRSDFPNQVNNVLCFPFIFRGALDVGATEINTAMMLACVDAIAALARSTLTEEVESIYNNESLEFGAEYLIPKPFDTRLCVDVSYAVAVAAMESGVASRPIADLEAYKLSLDAFRNSSQLFMQPVIDVARRGHQERLVYAEGENKSVLRTVQAVLTEGIAAPTVIGRRSVVTHRLQELGIDLKPGHDFELVDPEDDARYRDYWQTYHALTCRRGVSVAAAKTIMRTRTTAIAACMVAKDDVDAMICGMEGRFDRHLRHIIDVIGTDNEDGRISSLSVLLLPQGPLFITDAYINAATNAEDVARTTLAAAKRVREFGVRPKVALLSHSNFGSSRAAQARKMRDAVERLHELAPDLECDGEMHADAALNADIRYALNRCATLRGAANLLVLPSLDSANIAVELLRTLGELVMIGPVLSGTAKPAHIATPSTSVKGLFNLSALAVADVYSNKRRARSA